MFGMRLHLISPANQNHTSYAESMAPLRLQQRASLRTCFDASQHEMNAHASMYAYMQKVHLATPSPPEARAQSRERIRRMASAHQAGKVDALVANVPRSLLDLLDLWRQGRSRLLCSCLALHASKRIHVPCRLGRRRCYWRLDRIGLRLFWSLGSKLRLVVECEDRLLVERIRRLLGMRWLSIIEL